MSAILFCREELVRVDQYSDTSSLKDIIKNYFMVNKTDGYSAWDEDFGFYVIDVPTENDFRAEIAKAFAIMFNLLNSYSINNPKKCFIEEQGKFLDKVKKIFKTPNTENREYVKNFVSYYWATTIGKSAAEIADILRLNKIKDVTILNNSKLF